MIYLNLRILRPARQAAIVSHKQTALRFKDQSLQRTKAIREKLQINIIHQKPVIKAPNTHQQDSTTTMGRKFKEVETTKK
jgi:hypothetical protein